jgi:hypothetical protein
LTSLSFAVMRRGGSSALSGSCPCATCRRWGSSGRVCHIVGLGRNESTVDDPLGNDARSSTPCLESLGPEPTLRCRRDEMATDVESVVDRACDERNR